MTIYKEIKEDVAYRLINHGPVVLVSTRSEKGVYNIAPVAWTCPVEKSPSRVLIALGRGHKTYENIKETGEFALCVPVEKMAKLVRETGSVTGRKTDKFKEFNIKSFRCSKLDLLVPEDCLGWIETNVSQEFIVDHVSLVIGDTVHAEADREGFSDMVLAGNKNSRTLHHLGGGVFGVLEAEEKI